MSALVIVIVALICFAWAYKFYARKLESLWGIDPKLATPAFSKYDSMDYIPAKNWLVLFGHHFSSIAGAGPIIGPVIAVMLWGWVPALLWVVFGTIFIGAVHDFGSLSTSVREGGSSIADIAKSVISRRAKIIFSLFVWLALILVIAVFAYLCADTFVKEPKIVLPSLGLIPVAIIVGFLLYNLRANSLAVTVLGLLCLTALIFVGNIFPVKGTLNLWLAILFAYCFIASITPVNIILQPRDYLSSFLLFFSVIFGYLGLILAKPILSPSLSYIRQQGEGNYLWPALFVTVACGAVSGFHSLIASGTTSKQIANERQIKRISYGSMLIEALVAVLAIIAAAVVLGNAANLGVFSGVSPIEIFSRGYGSVTKNLLGNAGQFIAITTLNAFILTTLDTATRISRYLTEELFGLKNRYLSTSIIVAVSGALAFSGKWNTIWPVFGASNQLVAALALFVLSCWLLSKNKSLKFTLLPAFFMLITAVAALVFQGIKYFHSKDIVLLSVSVALVFLALFMALEVMPVIFARKGKNA